MSKQSEAKIKQGYVSKAIPKTCGNCAYFRSDIVTWKDKSFRDMTYTEEKGLRCFLGGFAVKKMGTCEEFMGKPDQPEDTKPLGDVIP